MAITLCEECFPGFADVEVYTVAPLSPCAACGRSDERRLGGLRCNCMPRDPRPQPAPMPDAIPLDAA